MSGLFGRKRERPIAAAAAPVAPAPRDDTARAEAERYRRLSGSRGRTSTMLTAWMDRKPVAAPRANVGGS